MQAGGFNDKMGAETDLDIVKTYLSKLRRVSIFCLILFYFRILGELDVIDRAETAHACVKTRSREPA